MLPPQLMKRTVETSDGHLLWTGGLANGRPAARYEGKVVYVRRLVWEMEHGPIPEGAVLVATCRERLCVAPSHLALGRPGRRDGRKDDRGKYAVEVGSDA